MRPQHITAENLQRLFGSGRLRIDASMRPQHITAENVRGEVQGNNLQQASMRPQHITAENSRSTFGKYRRNPLLQ